MKPIKDDPGSFLNAYVLKRLLLYVSPYRGVFLGVAVAAIVLSFLAVARLWLLKETVDDYILTKDLQGLHIFIAYMLVLLLAEVVVRYLFLYYANWIGQCVIRDIRIKLFKKMFGFKAKYYDNSSVGVLVTRTVSDTERIVDVLGQGFFEIVSDVIKMLVVIILMLITDWHLTVIIFAILPLILYATRLFQKAMKAAFSEVRLHISSLNSFVQERLSGMTIVQLFVREKQEFKTFQKINDKYKTAWIKTVWYNSIFFPIAELSTSITIGLIVWYGSYKIIDNQGIALGTIFMFIQLSQLLFKPLHQIADKFNTLQMGMIATNRIFKVFNTKSNIKNDGTLVASNIKGEISFRDVSFSYVKEETAIKNITFEIQQGEMVALVGATGSGKSTIVNLISRFYDIDKGNIYIDGKNINDYTLESLRTSMAIVLQDVFLFADTIYNNITLQNPNISSKKVIGAAKEIGIYDFIKTLPNGFNHNVKERGNIISAGQKQLIAFLRAYVIDPAILILDEATSSIDVHSEQLIQKATEKITQGRTSIIVAHRLSTIQKADKILVLSKGKIVETGTHKSLLKIENGYYRHLYEIQFQH